MELCGHITTRGTPCKLNKLTCRFHKHKHKHVNLEQHVKVDQLIKVDQPPEKPKALLPTPDAKVQLRKLNNAILNRNSVIKQQKYEIHSLNKKVAFQSKQMVIDNNIIADLKKTINEQAAYVEAYAAILAYDQLKIRIKSIVSFDKDWYINKLPQQTQYHEEIQAEFGMTPQELVQHYFAVKERRNKKAHPLTYELNKKL